MSIQDVIAQCDREHRTLVTPVKKDFVTKWWYRHGEVAAVQHGTNPVAYYLDVNLSDCVHESYTDGEQYAEVLNLYRENQNRIENQFRDALFDYLGIEHHPKRDTLYHMARDQSTGSYYSIMETAEELSELL